MKFMKLHYALLALLATSFAASSLTAASVEERLTALERQVNTIIDNEKERNNTINKISNNVMLIQKSLKPGEFADSDKMDVEEDDSMKY